jgi:hypothetical protein
MQRKTFPHLCCKPTNMGKYLCFSFLLLLHAFSFAQNSEKMPLKFESMAFNLGVAKGGHLVITTRAGEVAFGDGMNGHWRKADPVKAKDEVSRPLLDQGNFFNQDTGFVSGFINGKNDNYNLIYHTTNGGKKWKKIDFGQSGWVDDAVHLDNGEAWLSVAGSGFAYTTDYGFTWTKLSNPEPRQRFSKIYFNTKREGIIGSLYNLLAVSNDNCRNWTFLPTPLDQKAYTKTHQGSRPEFNRVAIYKDYYLVAQEDLVFYSPKDSVKWTWLPDYTDFYTDAENSALYFRTGKGGFVRSGGGFQAQQTFSLGNTYDAECRNGKLFVLGADVIHQLDPGQGSIASPIGSTDPGEGKPVLFASTSRGNYGYWKNRIYFEDANNGYWSYRFTLPVPPDGGSLGYVHEPQQILYRSANDSLYYFDLAGKLQKATTVASMLTAFREAGISKVIFTKGSMGCFHYNSAHAVYTLEDGALLRGRLEDFPTIGTGRGSQLEGSPAEISLHNASQFVQKLPQLFSGNLDASISDLAFSPSDYEQCKKDIIAFRESVLNGKNKGKGFQFPRNNLDFDRLISLVDSIPHLSPGRLKAYFMQTDINLSTTSNWVTIELVNARNEVLSISSSFYTPPPFYLPWAVSLNGLNVSSTSMTITRFIHQEYSGFLRQPDKVTLLHDLVKWLY